MIKTIEGKDYELRITRAGIREAERNGFDMSIIQSKPMLFVSYLWFAALWSTTKKSFDKCCDLLDKYLDEGHDYASTVEELAKEYAAVFNGAAE